MTTFTHAAVGGVAGSLGLGSPASFLVGMVSHLPLDLVPHWDIKKPWIDTMITVAVLAGLLGLSGPSPVFWGAAGAALPDVEHLFPLGRKYFPGHGKGHGNRLGRKHGLTQAALFLASILGIFLSGEMTRLTR